MMLAAQQLGSSSTTFKPSKALAAPLPPPTPSFSQFHLCLLKIQEAVEAGAQDGNAAAAEIHSCKTMKTAPDVFFLFPLLLIYFMYWRLRIRRYMAANMCSKKSAACQCRAGTSLVNLAPLQMVVAIRRIRYTYYPEPPIVGLLPSSHFPLC